MCPSIVVFDKDRRDLETVHSVLVEAGYDVRCASSTEQALELVRQQVPAVLFCALCRPGLEGGELVREIRAHLGLITLPIVVMNVFPAMAEEFNELMADVPKVNAVLHKPIIPAEVLLRAQQFAPTPTAREPLKERKRPSFMELLLQRIRGR